MNIDDFVNSHHLHKNDFMDFLNIDEAQFDYLSEQGQFFIGLYDNRIGYYMRHVYIKDILTGTSDMYYLKARTPIQPFDGRLN